MLYKYTVEYLCIGRSDTSDTSDSLYLLLSLLHLKVDIPYLLVLCTLRKDLGHSPEYDMSHMILFYNHTNTNVHGGLNAWRGA